MEEIESTLAELGLTQNEIKLYIANLRLGSARVEEISKKAGILRTTSYDILRSLVSKGFAASVIKSGVRYYSATEPKQILNLLDEKKRKVENILENMESMKTSIIAKPKMQMFEGLPGLKSVYADILATGSDLAGYGNAEHSWEMLTYFLPVFVKRRIKAGIHSRLILEKSRTSKELALHNKKELREIRFLDEMKDMETVVYIYGNKLAILTFMKKEPIAIIIENKEIADSQRILFESLWKIAKK